MVDLVTTFLNASGNVYLLVGQLPCIAKVQKSYVGYKMNQPRRLEHFVLCMGFLYFCNTRQLSNQQTYIPLTQPPHTVQ